MKPCIRLLLLALLAMSARNGLQAATPVKIGFPLEVALGVRNSIELEFPTEAGKIYQVEVSSDLKRWANDGYAIMGKGGPQTHITSTYNQPRLFFRVRNNGDPGRLLAGSQGPPGPPGPMPTDYATSAQGAKADTALQPEDLGATGAELLAVETVPDLRDLMEENPLLPLTASRILRDRQTTYDPYKITFISSGDSYAPNLGNPIHSLLAAQAADGMCYIANEYLREGGATPVSWDFSHSPNGEHCVLDGPGEGLVYPKTARNAYRVHVFYSTETGVPGTFTVQSKTDGGNWINIPGGENIDTNVANPDGAPVGAGVFTYSFPTTQARQFRAVWNSGTVRVLGITRSDIWEGGGRKGGLATYDLSFSGQTVQNASTCPQAVFNTILRTLKPDFASFKADDNAVQMSYLEAYLDKWNTAWPTDWLLFSSHPIQSNPTRELTEADRIVQSVAETHHYTFINCRKLFGTCEEMLAQGFLNPDRYHLSPYGSWYMERYVYGLIEKAIVPGGGYASPTYYGNSTDIEVLSFTNAFGSAAVPARIWSAQYNGTNGSFQFNIGSAGLGRMGWGSNGHLFITGGTQGWGYSSPAGKALREPAATAEIFADDWTTKPTLTLSAKSAHTSDALEIANAATQSSPGSRTAGIKPNGAADFTALKLTLNTYPNHAAADADGSLSSGQLYKLQGDRAVYQKP
jgi:hypothetical protein